MTTLAPAGVRCIERVAVPEKMGDLFVTATATATGRDESPRRPPSRLGLHSSNTDRRLVFGPWRPEAATATLGSEFVAA